MVLDFDIFGRAKRNWRRINDIESKRNLRFGDVKFINEIEA